MIRQAFVLGAGLGTRLLPLTAERPKPLIPVANRPLISYGFEHLLSAGVERFVVNTHWRAEAYGTEFPDAAFRGRPIAFSHEKPEVLETAGGLKNAEGLLRGEPFWVYNGDILTTLPLEPARRAHEKAGNEVTLVLRSSGGPLQVAFDEKTRRILDLGRRLKTPHEPRFLFTGVYLVEPAFLARVPAGKKVSVIPIFCEMIRAGAKLGGVVIDTGEWWDLGTREQYLAVHQALARGATPVEGVAPWVDSTARLGREVKVSGATAIGAHAQIGAGAHLTDCIIWNRAQVAPGAQLERCVVAGGAIAEGELRDCDLVTPVLD